jgi:endo-1,4-beta-xylanase
LQEGGFILPNALKFRKKNSEVLLAVQSSGWKKSGVMMLSFVLLWTLLVNGGMPVQANAEPGPLAFGFEDETTQGWFGRGDTLSIAEGGTKDSGYSLHSSGRTATWQGPGYQLGADLVAGELYAFEAYIKLESGAEDTIANLMIDRASGGASTYERVGSAFNVTVTADSWTKPSGTYIRPAGADELTLYVELPESLDGFYVDEVSIAPAERIVSDFEDGELQHWGARGGVETLTVKPAAAYESDYGLEVTGRTEGWHGPTRDMSSFMEAGRSYNLSAWVRLPAGTPAGDVSLLIQRQTNGQTYYEVVAGRRASDSGWVQVSGVYELKDAFENIAVYMESFGSPTMSFYVDDIIVERAADFIPIEIQHDIPSLKDVFADDFLLGSSLLVNEIEEQDGPHAQLLKKHFNSLTAGNELKWDATEPREGEFTFERADQIMEFAEDNDIAFRGHTLIWHSQTPDWVFYDDNHNLVSKEVLYERMENHINEVMGRYKGKVYAWDVVNEVIEVGDGKPNGLRNSLWYQIAGEEFIEKAFEFAHAADPDAKLFINDYNTNIPDKRQALYELIERLKDKNIPVDGIGHQTHIGIEYPSIQELDDMIDAFRDLGIEQQITELDMSIYTNDDQAYDTFPLELQIKQARRYGELFDVFKKHKDQITAVIFWGKDDINTWLRTFPVARNNWPTPFDERLQAKYAYWALVDPTRVPLETQIAEAAGATVTVDGERESAWNLAKPVAITNGEGEAAGQFSALWDTDNLYLSVEVNDATNADNDAVQVFVDANNGKTASYEADDLSYTFARDAEGYEGPGEYRSVETTGGYRLEISLPLANGAAGTIIGFDVRIDDSASGVVAKSSWNDKHHGQETDTSRFGELHYVEGPRDTSAVYGTPVIDGTKDTLWNEAAEIQTDRWVLGNSGSTAKVRTLWDEEYLYVLAEVTDSLLSKRSPNVWEQDSIEIFIDQNNGKTTTYQPDDGQYRINFDNEQSVAPTALAVNLTSAAQLTADGYIVEAAIRWNGTAPEAEAIIGFDVQVNNDESDSGVRDSVAIWNDISGNSWSSMSGLGVLQLLSENDEQEPNPTPTQDPTPTPTSTPTTENSGGDSGSTITPTPTPTLAPTLTPAPTSTPYEPKFADTKGYSWAEEAIHALAQYGIVKGTSETTFTPERSVTRAEFVTLLVRTLGLQADFSDNFRDVAQNAYYYEAVGILKQLGIANGIGGEQFQPNGQISRQDLMVLIERALQASGKLEINGNAPNLSSFSDSADVAPYAQAAAAALVKEGIVAGSGNGKLNPRGTATRAETAVILYRILNKYPQLLRE